MKFHPLWESHAGKSGSHSFSYKYKILLPHSFHRVLHSPWLAFLLDPLPVRWEPCFSHQQMLCHPSFIFNVSVLALASVQSRLPLSSHPFQRGHLLIVLVVPLDLSCLLLNLAHSVFQVILLPLNPETHLFSFHFEQRTLGPPNRLWKSLWATPLHLLSLWLPFLMSVLEVVLLLKAPSSALSWTSVTPFGGSSLCHQFGPAVFLTSFTSPPRVLPPSLYLKNINKLETFILPCYLHRPFSSCCFSFQHQPFGRNCWYVDIPACFSPLTITGWFPVPTTMRKLLS